MEPIRIDTPENVDLSLEPVGLGSRFVAAAIDSMIQWIVGTMLVVVFAMVLAATQTSPAAEITIMVILALAALFLLVLYKPVFEAVWNGQTIGKRIVGIRVVQVSGMPVTFPQVVVRNLLRIIDIMPSSYLIGAICVLATQRRQRLGDLAAGTVVVRDRPQQMPVLPDRLSHDPTVDLTRLREHALRLSEDDLQPARRYWQRRQQLDPAMRARLAAQVAKALAVRMDWMDPLPANPEEFIEEVLYVRAQ